jgi:hypothetical protein
VGIVFGIIFIRHSALTLKRLTALNGLKGKTKKGKIYFSWTYAGPGTLRSSRNRGSVTLKSLPPFASLLATFFKILPF